MPGSAWAAFDAHLHEFQDVSQLLAHGSACLELHQRKEDPLWPGNVEAIFDLSSQKRTFWCLFKSTGGGRRNTVGMRPNDDTLVGNPFEVFAHPLAQLASTPKGDELHPMSATRE